VHIVSELANANITKYNIVSAVDGYNLDINNLESTDVTIKGKELALDKSKKVFGLTLTPGAIGCALSHKNIWANVNDPTLILEDDAALSPDFITQLNERLALCPDDFDMLYLSSYINKAKMPGEDTKLFVPRGQVNGTMGYIVSPTGAQKLLQYCFPLDKYQIDTVLYKNFKKIKVFHCNPKLIRNPKLKSDVQNLHHYSNSHTSTRSPNQ